MPSPISHFPTQKSPSVRLFKDMGQLLGQRSAVGLDLLQDELDLRISRLQDMFWRIYRLPAHLLAPLGGKRTSVMKRIVVSQTPILRFQNTFEHEKAGSLTFHPAARGRNPWGR